MLAKDEYNEVKNNIITLMRADGEKEGNISVAKNKNTIAAMLETFAVGTQRKKLSIPRLPDPSELIPLKELKLNSSTCKAKEMVNKCNLETISTTDDEEMEEDAYIPNYIETYLS